MDVLPRLLPQSDSKVESAVFSVSIESNNGFDLLWRILELMVPGFKSMNPVQVLVWTSHLNILSFCRGHLLYFRLQSKHNMFFNARMQTNIFLCNIQQSEYADVVTSLQSHANAYLAEDDEGYLPANLCINGIATAIHRNALAWVRDVGKATPWVRQLVGDWDSESLSSFDDDKLPLCAVQGYSLRENRVEHGQDRNRSSYGWRSFNREGAVGRGSCDFDRDRAGLGYRALDRDKVCPSPRDRAIPS
jgi:hypothetical protein